MSQLHDTLQVEMTEAQMRHTQYYDAQRNPDASIRPGDRLWLLRRNIRTIRPCKKLDYKKIGPFKILVKIGTRAYKLHLPASMRIHNTFHISLLDLYNDNKFPSQRSGPPPPINIEGEPEYELQEIVDSRLHYNKLQYRAKWTGYSPEHDKTWYPADNFENADLAKRNFHSRYPSKPHLDQSRGTGERGDARLRISDTEPGRSPSTPTEDSNRSGKLGNHDRLAGNDTDKRTIPFTFGLGRSGTKAKRTRCTPLDGVLQGQLLGVRQRESGAGMVPQEVQCYAIRLEPAIQNEGTSTGKGPSGPNIKKPARKGKTSHQRLEGMLQRQMPDTGPIQGGRGIPSAEGRNNEGPLALAPVPPRPKVPCWKERCRRDMTGEGGERKNPTPYPGLTQADPGTVGRKCAIPKKRGRIPQEDRRPTSQDGVPTRGHPRASQDGCRIGIQFGKIEERGGRCEKRKPGPRAPEPRATERDKKSWAEVARLGQLASRDQC